MKEFYHIVRLAEIVGIFAFLCNGGHGPFPGISQMYLNNRSPRIHTDSILIPPAFYLWQLKIFLAFWSIVLNTCASGLFVQFLE